MSSAVGIRAFRRNKVRSKSTEDAHLAERRLLERSIPRHIARYFSEFELDPEVDVCHPRYVQLCLETNICDAVDLAYKAIADSGRYKLSCAEGMLAEDVLLVIGILRSMRARAIPQEFSPGILLMHLELVEGISFLNET
jgi:hypothetical protein